MPNWFDVALDIANRLNRYSDANEPTASSYPITIVDTQPVDSRSTNFLTQERFDSIEYDSSHLWICQIDSAPPPYNSWFPAQDVQEPSKGLSVSPMSFGIEEVNTLSNYNAQTLRVEFIDDDKATLENWICNWQENCSGKDAFGNPYMGFKYLEDILKIIKITKYTWQKDKVYTHAYSVLPVMEILRPHNNEPTLKTLNVSFAVFGSSKI